MKTIKIDLPQEPKEFEILPLADFHVGDLMSDWEYIRELLKYVETHDNCYCVLGGDLMDTAICSSVGDTYGENLKPMEQIEMCVKLFAPIKDKILAVCGGNHENRVYKTDGLDMTQIFCNQLGIGDRYTATTALLFIRCGIAPKSPDKTHTVRKLCYTMYLAHGTGGGRKEGGKLNRLADLTQIVDADIYVCGHTHLPASFKTGYFRVNYGNGSVQHVTKLFVNTASALDYGGYGDRNNYKPTAKDYPIIRLDCRRKKATAEL